MKELGLPEIIEQQCEADHASLVIRVDHGLACLRGHFPDLPVVPGVAQLHWAIHFGQQLFALSDEVNGIEAVKYQELMQPGMVATLTLRYDQVKQKLTFTIADDHRRFSSGRVVCAPR